MNSTVTVESELEVGSQLDPIEEIRLRTWARRNYSPANERDLDWHPVVLDEMNKVDREQVEE